jgi:hypothetical protein
VRARVSAIAAAGSRGHLVMVVDPVEETFPFSGEAELVQGQRPALGPDDLAQGVAVGADPPAVGLAPGGGVWC